MSQCLRVNRKFLVKNYQIGYQNILLLIYLEHEIMFLVFYISSGNHLEPVDKKMKFSIKDFFSKCDQIRRKLQKKIENFSFCAVN